MPFVIPKVVAFDEHNSTRVVAYNANPGEQQLAAYIEWLEREIASAKVAWSQMTNTGWDAQPK